MDIGALLRRCATLQFRHDQDHASLLLPEGIYRPDAWTTTTLIAVEACIGRIEKPDPTIAEVGVGSGVVPILLSRLVPHLKYYGFDINPVACEVARINLELNGVESSHTLVPGGDLFDRAPSYLRNQVDIIVANLPQIPSSFRAEQEPNDYYAPTKPGLTAFDRHGLGLLDRLLGQSRQYLSPQGVIAICVAGRCDDEHIRALLKTNEMQLETISTIRTLQDGSTSLDPLTSIEQELGETFRFYSSQTSTESISAFAAADAIRRGLPTFFNLHACVARPWAR